jgi:hypothetical protein
MTPQRVTRRWTCCSKHRGRQLFAETRAAVRLRKSKMRSISWLLFLAQALRRISASFPCPTFVDLGCAFVPYLLRCRSSS